MKVLMTADAAGGVWTYALELADALAEQDVAVALAVTGPAPSSEQRLQLRPSRVAAYHERGYALEWMEGAAEDVPRSGYWLLGLCDEEQPDVVHLNGYALAALPLAVPVVVVAHSCVLSWHEAVRGRPAGPEWSWYRRAVSAGLAAASAVVAPTAAMLAEIERLYGPRGERLVIPNGRSPLAAPLPKRPLVVGAGRRWDEAKNLAALERVAPALEWPVVVADGDMSATELGRLLARASVFAAPARYEPFGLAGLEAALAGCALVLGDIRSLRELWDGAALFVDPSDDEALLDGLRRALRRPEPLAEAARARARRYTPARMAAAYLDLYERLLTEQLDPLRRVLTA